MKNHALAIILPLLRNASGLDYFKRVAFVTLPSLAIGFISHCSYWNWFGFTTSYCLGDHHRFNHRLGRTRDGEVCFRN
ncbi:MAG: hypothetical protein KZQ99_10240 [Candidatus Thiodiazotropha sp. (ex Dulcina madagascariensis)]|nr:hypothetical protein [Candidatus Thiodiazotropha sp. (ex Dulcina madagascariensis)]MCU7928038.1 hypothetical protein [Candidatus Thiodiazotropha sp. (ex Dulcina madagascariensis)]MCU7935245.1 hypothetical protein [Candidatus Thiodiazotropha sp. (ex Dulcina madagascariensis)]